MANDILVKIGANITDFSRKMAESQKALRKFSDDSQLVFDSFKQTGAMVTGAGIALSVGLGSAVKTASDFDTQMSKVKAISGATEEEFNKLRETAKKLGAETAFSASQASEGMEYLALAGWKTNDIIKAMPGLLDLAAAGALDLGTASDIVSDTMSAFGLSAEQAAHASDVFAYAQANANTNVEQMGEAMNYLAPTAKSMGWSLEESSAIIMELANNGLKGSMATQAFGSSLVRLAAPTPKATKLIKKLGLEFFDAQGQMKSMPEVLKELEVGLKGMSDEQKAAAMDVLVGKNAYKQWQILLEAGSDSLADMTNNLRNADGTAADMAETMLDNLGGSIILLKSALEGMAISIGEILIPYIQKAVEFINKLVDWFNGLSDTTKQIIVITAALAAVFALIVGPILLLIGFIPQIISGFGAIATVFGVTSAALLKGILVFTGIVGAIIGVAIALVVAYKKVEWFRNAVDGAFAWIVETAKAIGPAIKTAFGASLDWAAEKLTALKGVATVVKDGIVKAFGAIRNTFSGLGESTSGLFSGIVDKAKEFLGNIKSAFSGNPEDLIPVIMQIVPSIIGFLLGGWPRIIIIVSRFLPMIAEGMQTGLPKIVEVIENVVESIVGFIQNNLPQLIQTGLEVVLSLLNGILSAIPSLIEAASEIILTLVSAIAEFLPTILLAGIEVLTSLLDGIISAIPSIIDVVLTVIDTLITTIIDNLPTVIDTGMEVLTSLIDGIIKVLPLLIGAALMLILNIVDTIVINLPKIIDAGIKILFSLIDGIVKILPVLIETAIKLVLQIVDTLIKNLPKIISAGMKILSALISGIVKILPQLISTAVQLIVKIAGILIQNLPKILAAGVRILKELIKGIISIIGELISAVKDKIIPAIVDKLKEVDLVQTGKDIIKGLIKGIGSMGSAVWEATKGIGSKIKNGFTSFFKIKSPSRLMMSLAKHIPGGAIAGMDSMRSKVEQASDRMAEAMTPDVRSIDMSYATPSGMASNLSAAVAGTVDVNAREEMIAGAIDNLNRKLDSLRIEMNEREMGRFVSDVATESRSSAVRSGGRRRI